jgi:hypothetical protein
MFSWWDQEERGAELWLTITWYMASYMVMLALAISSAREKAKSWDRIPVGKAVLDRGVALIPLMCSWVRFSLSMEMWVQVVLVLAGMLILVVFSALAELLLLAAVWVFMGLPILIHVGTPPEPVMFSLSLGFLAVALVGIAGLVKQLLALLLSLTDSDIFTALRAALNMGKMEVQQHDLQRCVLLAKPRINVGIQCAVNSCASSC